MQSGCKKPLAGFKSQEMFERNSVLKFSLSLLRGLMLSETRNKRPRGIATLLGHLPHTVQVSQNAPAVAHVQHCRNSMGRLTLGTFSFFAGRMSCWKVCSHITVGRKKERKRRLT